MTAPRRRLAHASFWTMAGTGVHLGAGMLSSIALARLLGPVRFGELAILRTTLLTVTLVVGAQLGVATTRAIAALRTTDAARAGRVLGMLSTLGWSSSALAALICLVLAAPIARQLGAPGLVIPVALLAPAMLFACMSCVHTGAMNGFETFAAAGSLLAAEGVVTAVLLVAGAWVDGVRGAVLAMIASAALFWFLRRRTAASIIREHGVVVQRPPRILYEFRLIRSLVLPTALFGLATQPFAWLARVMLARYGLAEVGLFSAAYSWGAAVFTVPAQITRPAMSILTNLLAQGDRNGFRQLLRDTMLVACGAALVVALPLMLLSPWIMRAYGSRFATAAPVLCVIAASSILASLSAALRSALVASGEVWGQVVQSLLWGFALIGMFLALRERGAMALAIAYTVAYGLTLLIQFVLTAAALRSGRPSRSAVDLSDPAIAETSALLDDPEAS